MNAHRSAHSLLRLSSLLLCLQLVFAGMHVCLGDSCDTEGLFHGDHADHHSHADDDHGAASCLNSTVDHCTDIHLQEWQPLIPLVNLRMNAASPAQECLSPAPFAGMLPEPDSVLSMSHSQLTGQPLSADKSRVVLLI